MNGVSETWVMGENSWDPPGTYPINLVIPGLIGVIAKRAVVIPLSPIDVHGSKHAVSERRLVHAWKWNASNMFSDDNHGLMRSLSLLIF